MEYFRPKPNVWYYAEINNTYYISAGKYSVYHILEKDKYLEYYSIGGIDKALFEEIKFSDIPLSYMRNLTPVQIAKYRMQNE